MQRGQKLNLKNRFPTSKVKASYDNLSFGLNYLSSQMNHRLLIHEKTITHFYFIYDNIGSVSAQVGKGGYYLGGNINYNYDQAGTTNTYSYTTGTTVYTNYHITDFQVSPDFGFFLSDNWAVGLQLGYSRDAGTEIK